MKTVKVERLLHKGENNPNVNKPYFNMELKLEEFFKFFESQSCEVPISIRREEDLYSLESRPEDIIGFVKEFSDTDMTIEVYNEELFSTFKDPRVEICSDVDKEMIENEIYVEKVIKLLMSEKES